MPKLDEPVSWNIKVEPVDAGYLLVYIEGFPNTEEHMKGVKATKELASRLPMFNNVEIVEKDKIIEVYFKYIGTKQDIVDMLACEFLGFSRLGKTTLHDLFAKLFVDSCIAGSPHSIPNVVMGNIVVKKQDVKK